MNFFNLGGSFGGFPSMFGDSMFDDSENDEYNYYGNQHSNNRSSRNKNEPIDNQTYYKVLGVDKTATTDEIHRAFRKQAMKHHPDRGGDAKTFQLINEAHEVLVDEKKRSIYDEEGKQGLENRHDNDEDMDEEEKGDDIRVEISVNLETLYTGHSIMVPIRRNEICNECKGTCGGPNAVSVCKQCQGKGHMLRQIQMGFFVTQQAVDCPNCHGTGKFINRRLCCQRCKGEGVVCMKRSIEVYIEPGLKNHNKIRLSEEGNQIPNKRAGDLIVIIKEKQHNRFKRLNCDLGVGLHISVFESLLGFKQRITHLDGHIIEITNPEGVVIKPGTVYKIESEGMPVKGNTHIHGSLFVTFHVDFPNTIDAGFVKDMQGILKNKPTYISKLHRDYILDKDNKEAENHQYEGVNIDNEAPVTHGTLTACNADDFGHTIQLDNYESSDDDNANNIQEQCRSF